MPVQRNNLSWLYTTVGFCSVKFSLYLLLCPDSRRPQPGYPVYGAIVRLFSQVFDGASNRRDIADSCAYRTGSHVRLCAHRKTRRSHRSGIRTSNRPSPHKPVPKRTLHSLHVPLHHHPFHHRWHWIPAEIRPKRKAAFLCRLNAIRHVKPRQLPCHKSGTPSTACMRRHTSCTESRHSITDTRRKHRIMHVTTCTTRQKPPNTTGIAEVPPDCACHDTHNLAETPHTTTADRDAGHSHMPGSRIPPQLAQQGYSNLPVTLQTVATAQQSPPQPPPQPHPTPPQPHRRATGQTAAPHSVQHPQHAEM